MVLTTCGCLLLFCSGVAVCLFAWLTYTIFAGTRADRPEEFDELESVDN